MPYVMSAPKGGTLTRKIRLGAFNVTIALLETTPCPTAVLMRIRCVDHAQRAFSAMTPILQHPYPVTMALSVSQDPPNRSYAHQEACAQRPPCCSNAQPGWFAHRDLQRQHCVTWVISALQTQASRSRALLEANATTRQCKCHAHPPTSAPRERFSNNCAGRGWYALHHSKTKHVRWARGAKKDQFHQPTALLVTIALLAPATRHSAPRDRFAALRLSKPNVHCNRSVQRAPSNPSPALLAPCVNRQTPQPHAIPCSFAPKAPPHRRYAQRGFSATHHLR